MLGVLWGEGTAGMQMYVGAVGFLLDEWGCLGGNAGVCTCVSSVCGVLHVCLYVIHVHLCVCTCIVWKVCMYASVCQESVGLCVCKGSAAGRPPGEASTGPGS